MVRFKSADELFSCVVEGELSSISAVDKFSTAPEFVVMPSTEKRKAAFRNFVFLPPYALSPFLSIQSRQPGDLVYVAKSAAESLNNSNGGHPDLNEDDHKQALDYVLSFL